MHSVGTDSGRAPPPAERCSIPAPPHGRRLDRGVVRPATRRWAPRTTSPGRRAAWWPELTAVVHLRDRRCGLERDGRPRGDSSRIAHGILRSTDSGEAARGHDIGGPRLPCYPSPSCPDTGGRPRVGRRPRAGTRRPPPRRGWARLTCLSRDALRERHAVDRAGDRRPPGQDQSTVAMRSRTSAGVGSEVAAVAFHTLATAGFEAPRDRSDGGAGRAVAAGSVGASPAGTAPRGQPRG